MMIEPVFDEQKGMWGLPDAREFVSNCRWEGKRYIVPTTIEGTVYYKSHAIAILEAGLLTKTIHSSQKMAERFA